MRQTNCFYKCAILRLKKVYHIRRYLHVHSLHQRLTFQRGFFKQQQQVNLVQYMSKKKTTNNMKMKNSASFYNTGQN